MQFKPDTKTNKLQALSTLADSILIELNNLYVSGRLHKLNFSFFIVLIVAKLKKEHFQKHHSFDIHVSNK